MPRTGSTNLGLVSKAVNVLKIHTTLSVPQAMLLAGFSDNERNDPNIRRAILRRLPGGGKRKSITLTDSVPPTTDSSDQSPVSSITTTTGASSSLSLSSLSSSSEIPSTLSKQYKSRLTSEQKQKSRVSDLAAKEKEKAAHKDATMLYHQERSKGQGGLSVREVAEATQKKHNGVGPSASTIHKYVVDLQCGIGVSPMKKGHCGNIPPVAYKALCSAFASKLRICQLNASSSTRKDQIEWLMSAFGYGRKQASKLWERVSRDTAVDIIAGKVKRAEERRVEWTTYHNLDLWFAAWERTLDELGFFEYDSCGNKMIPEHKLKDILNFDETCLSLDGSTITRGGRPPVAFEDENLPRVGKPTSKSSQTSTMITGSNALGEALPPHFQFMSSAQTDEGRQVRREAALYFKNVIGRFGLDKERRSVPVAVGSNEKGGMDDEEFAIYLRTSIMPLYPNAAPEKGRWVILKCDSGPGRMNIELLAELRLAGFILFPGVPNTTAVSQETDRNYGPFKGAYSRNLDLLVENRIKRGKSSSIPAWMVGLIVFGGTDPETNYVLEENAFQEGFSVEACLSAWAKVGAAPLTKACLSDPKVRKSVGDGDDEFDQHIKLISDANIISTYTLNECGYNGSAFKGVIVPVKKPKIITEENTLERRQALKDALSQSEKFSKTGGYHMTCDDIFISTEMGHRTKSKKALTIEKARRLRQMATEEKARVILEKKGDDKLTGTDLNVLLGWYKIAKIGDLSKDEKMEKWKKLRQDNVQPPAYDKWTDEDERKLIEASKEDLGIGDTAVGRLEAKRKRDFIQTASKFTPEEWTEIMAQRNADNISTIPASNTVNGTKDSL